MNAIIDWTSRALAEVVPPSCGLGCELIGLSGRQLLTEEAVALGNATIARKLEFTAGRAAAQKALRQLGLPSTIIPVHADRSPIWPHGIIGSIAHTKEIAVAAVAKTQEIIAIGIDIEVVSAVTPALWPEIMLSSEIGFLNSLPDHERDRYATVIFSIKEAFYKFQFPLTHQWLDFHDVEVRLDIEHRNCSLRTTSAVRIDAEVFNVFCGYFCIGESFVLTAVYAQSPFSYVLASRA